jgi:LuxR family maltose regulon positive regulatory protein
MLVLSGRHREALAVLAAVTHTPHEFSRLRVEALLLSAMAYQRLGETDSAATYLAKALHHGEFAATFASVPRALLADGAKSLPALATLLDELDARVTSRPFPDTLDIVSLTDRERRLVELLPTSRSRDSIARSLFVSTNTVKTQLQALYRKLGVSSREEAVVRAYELGLLS